MKFYRYEIEQYSDFGRDMDGEIIPSILPPRTELALRKFVLIKETPKGYWIGYEHWFSSMWKKWVSKTSKKRYAYPTEEEALVNFIKRTERRIKYLTVDLDACKTGLIIAKTKQHEIQST